MSELSDASQIVSHPQPVQINLATVKKVHLFQLKPWSPMLLFGENIRDNNELILNVAKRSETSMQVRSAKERETESFGRA